MSVQWYYVDQAQATIGPVSEEVLSKEYAEGNLHDNSFVWNGTTVDQWKYISAVPGLSDKLRPKPKPKPVVVKRKPVPPIPQRGAREKKFQSAKSRSAASTDDEERINLLAAIRVGKTLKTRQNSEAAKKEPFGQMSLAEQMKEKLSKRNQNQPRRISNKKSKSVTRTQPRHSRDKVKTQPRTSLVKLVNRGSGGSRSQRGALPYKFKNKVAYIHDAVDKLSAEDGWKILAIEKILKD